MLTIALPLWLIGAILAIFAPAPWTIPALLLIGFAQWLVLIMQAVVIGRLRSINNNLAALVRRVPGFQR